MDNKELAKYAARFCFSAGGTHEEQAAGWVIEMLVLPTGIESYSTTRLEEYILNALERKDQAKGEGE